jgi:hypothetical protein
VIFELTLYWWPMLSHLDGSLWHGLRK